MFGGISSPTGILVTGSIGAWGKPPTGALLSTGVTDGPRLVVLSVPERYSSCSLPSAVNLCPIQSLYVDSLSLKVACEQVLPMKYFVTALPATLKSSWLVTQLMPPTHDISEDLMRRLAPSRAHT